MVKTAKSAAKGRAPSYPWQQWLNLTKRKVFKRGRDFFIKPEEQKRPITNFTVLFYQNAARYRKKGAYDKVFSLEVIDQDTVAFVPLGKA